MKRMLLIGMNFHTYEPQIIKEYEKQGYVVDKVEDHPDEVCGYSHLPISVKTWHRGQFQKRVLMKVEQRSYDIVLVLVGRYLQPFFLKSLKGKNPKAKFVLYLWDDVARVENFFDVKDFYDEVVSFDPCDCAKYGFRFLPLYYLPQYSMVNKEKKYDVCSVMYEHSDRVKIIRLFLEKYEDSLKQYYHVVAMGAKSFLKYFFGENKKKDLKSGLCYTRKQLSIDETAKLMGSSKAIVDVQQLSQKGLTQRTIESLGAKIKLLTTNSQVRYYDFYNPNNIIIIDRTHPEVTPELIKQPYEGINQVIYEKYSLHHWAKNLVEGSADTYLNCTWEEFQYAIR